MKVEMNNNVERVYTQQEAPRPKEVKQEPRPDETQQPKREELTEKETAKVKEFTDRMNKELEAANTEIEFKVHESDNGGLNKVSIKVIDKTNDKVIVEIPSEESIEFAEKMDEITGMLFDHRG